MLKSISKTIKVLIASDFVLNLAWGLLSPIFAIFIVQNITVGDMASGVRVAGFASLFYWIIKSILQIPISHYLDKNHGEKDDFVFLIVGMFLISLVPFGYLISSLPWHIYVSQTLYAIGMAMLYPPWMAIFTRHIDKGKEAFEWGLNSTTLGFSTGIAGAVGGILVSILGFKTIFVFVGVLNILSTIMLLAIRKRIHPKNGHLTKVPPITPFFEI